MKQKIYKLIPTGEVRPPTVGEYYITSMAHNQPNTPTMAHSNLIASFPILKLEVVEEEWKPKEGENYYTIIISGTSMTTCMNIWTDNTIDNILYNEHNCFQTRTEAEEKLAKIKQVLKERGWAVYESDLEERSKK